MASRCALVAGATGLVGGHVVDALVERADVDRVRALVRKKTGKWPSPKVEETVVDYDALDGVSFAGASEVYLCLGTTIKKAGSQQVFRKVDHDYPVAVAKAAKAAGATRCALVSAIGASPNASSFYHRVKGETDRDVEAVGFEHFVIAEPSLLIGDRQESRLGERFAIAATGAVQFLLAGGLSKYKNIEARQVARAMVAALPDAGAKRVLRHDEMIALSR